MARSPTQFVFRFLIPVVAVAVASRCKSINKNFNHPRGHCYEAFVYERLLSYLPGCVKPFLLRAGEPVGRIVEDGCVLHEVHGANFQGSY